MSFCMHIVILANTHKKTEWESTTINVPVTVNVHPFDKITFVKLLLPQASEGSSKKMNLLSSRKAALQMQAALVFLSRQNKGR